MSKVVKPPTIVVYADSPDAITNVINVLQKTLEPDRYVYVIDLGFNKMKEFGDFLLFVSSLDTSFTNYQEKKPVQTCGRIKLH